MKKCLSATCNNQTKQNKAKYCCNQCQQNHKWQKLSSIIESDQINELGFGLEYSASIAKRFLIEKNGAKCQKCSWSEINPSTNRIPIEIDHIDGDCNNNKLSNLRLLCPNCHSLTPTYKGANKGNGSTRYNKWKKYFSSNN